MNRLRSTLLGRLLYSLYLRYLVWRDPVRFARTVGVKLGHGVKLYGAHPGMFGSEPWLITLGDDVHIVAPCNFITHDGGVLILRHRHPDLEITRPIKVGNRVYLGINCIVLPGVVIGDDVIIGAGSVVTKDIPSRSVYAGVPARFVKSLDDYERQAKSRSLGYGALSAADKDAALRKHYGEMP